jgi:phosphoglycerate kinase
MKHIFCLSQLKTSLLKDKKVLLRTDLNIKSELASGAFRFKAAIPSISFLLKKGAAKVIILSHFGRPKTKDKKFSLKPFVEIFEKRLKQKVLFIQSFDFNRVKKQLAKTENQLILLENLRFHPGEAKKDPHFAEELALLA